MENVSSVSQTEEVNKNSWRDDVVEGKKSRIGGTRKLF